MQGSSGSQGRIRLVAPVVIVVVALVVAVLVTWLVAVGRLELWMVVVGIALALVALLIVGD